MAKLNENSTFVEEVLRLDIDMPVRGYDGKELGVANEQAQVLANRTRYLKDAVDKIDGDVDALTQRVYVETVNEKSGQVELTYEDVGAAASSHKHTPADIRTNSLAQFASAQEKNTWNAKQDALTSGSNIKTIAGQSVLGGGNVEIKSSDVVESDELQFISEDDRTNWDAKQNKLESGKNIATIHNNSLLSSGNITLTAADVGADPKGSASQAVDDHLADADPHSQYLTSERGGELYVDKQTGNKPNGYLQLDEKGQIPAAIAKLFEVRYIIASSKEERLAIEGSSNVTICLQTDENRIYYLDAGGDPSVESEWHSGRDADPSEVISVFGRSGVISAEAGDYTADQITETDSRVFVTTKEKTAWSGKQDTLVSGTTIKTINNQAVLGSGDISITTESIDAAERVHTHNVNDIETSDEKQFVSVDEKAAWNAKQGKLVSGSNVKTINNESVLGSGEILITAENIGAALAEHTHVPADIKTDDDNQFVTAEEKETWGAKQDALTSGKNLATVFGQTLLSNKDITLNNVTDLATFINGVIGTKSGITITLDKASNKINFSVPKANSDNAIKIQSVTGAKKGVAQIFQIDEADNFNFRSYVLHKVTIDNTASATVRFDSTYFNRILAKTSGVYTDSSERIIIKTKDTIDFTKGDDGIYTTGTQLDTDITSLGILGDNSPNGIVPTMTSATNGTFTVTGSDAYSKDFAAYSVFGAKVTSTTKLSKDFYRSKQTFNNTSKLETYIQLDCGSPIPINRYTLSDPITTVDSSTGAPTGWKLLGRNADSENWVTIDEKTNQSNTFSRVIPLDKHVSYRYYKLLITSTTSPTATTRIGRFQINYVSLMLIRGNDGKQYTVENGELKEVSTFKDDGFYTATISASKLETIAPYEVVAEYPRVGYFTYGRNPQIVVNQYVTDDNPATFWQYLKKATPTSTGTDASKIKVAFSPDGANWFTLQSGSWVKNDTQLTNDTASANYVNTSGLAVTSLASITEAQWQNLFAQASGKPQLGLAFTAPSSATANTQIVPDSIAFTFSNASGWEKTATPTRIVDKSIMFIPQEDGDYQFCFRFYAD